ncbi:MAG: hypothetical protein WD595_01985 [Waddliaceae bacterium]
MNIFREAKRSIEEGNFPARRTAVVGGILATLLLVLIIIFDFSGRTQSVGFFPANSHSELFGVRVVSLLVILLVSGAFVLLVRQSKNSLTKFLLGSSIVLVVSSFVWLLGFLADSFIANITESLPVNGDLITLGFIGLSAWVISWWIHPIYELVAKCKLLSWWLFAIFTTIILPIYAFADFIIVFSILPW